MGNIAQRLVTVEANDVHRGQIHKQQITHLQYSKKKILQHLLIFETSCFARLPTMSYTFTSAPSFELSKGRT